MTCANRWNSPSSESHRKRQSYELRTKRKSRTCRWTLPADKARDARFSLGFARVCREEMSLEATSGTIESIFSRNADVSTRSERVGTLDRFPNTIGDEGNSRDLRCESSNETHVASPSSDAGTAPAQRSAKCSARSAVYRFLARCENN